jgi:hypothetical protein
MRLLDRAFVLALVAAASLTASSLRAQEAEGDDEPLPAGHPSVNGRGGGQEQQGGGEGQGAQPANPHARANGGPQTFQPPADTDDEDPRIPAGTIAITILDPDNVPLPNTPVTLGILHNSVAKGESREHKLALTDAKGEVTFPSLDRASGIAYRVSVTKDGGTFWASPFGLPPDKGMRVALHVYPVTHDIEKALIVAQVVVYAEMKDDRVQLEQALTIYNLGRVAWIPDDVMLGLPPDYTALTSQETMTGEGVTAIDKKGAKLHGTFGPGQHVLDFRWQLPYAGEKDVTFDETLIPHVAVMRVMAAASQEMRLVATGFPEAEPRTDAQGERVLITEKQMRRDDPPLAHLHVELRDLPTPGPGRVIATLLAGLGVLAGLGYAFASKKAVKPAEASKEERARLLHDLEELERAHRTGDIGPKTYERARRELIDAIARSLVVPKTAE